MTEIGSLKQLGTSFVWILLSCSIITTIGFLPSFASHASSVIISSSASTFIVGQSATFTATVSPSNATGTVRFNDTSTTPPTILGTAIIAGGFATFSTSSLSVGNHNIVATYLGDTNNAPSTSTALILAINPAPLVATGIAISSTESASFHGIVSHFTDADPNAVASDYAGTINWGDGTTTSAVIATNSNGGFDLQGTHTYSEEGSYHLSITIVDNDATTATVTSTATVTDAPLTASATNINAVAGVSFHGIVSHFTDADPNAVASDYAGTINWGDGTTTSAVIATNSNGGFDLQGTHTFVTTGTTSVSITINDTGGSSVVATGTATITKTSSAIIVSSSLNPSTSGQSVTFTATVSPSTATGTVQFNDTSTSPPTILGAGSLSGGIATFSTSSLSVGNHNIIAKYMGDANNVPSTSPALVQTVNQAPASPTTTSLSSNTTSIIFGKSVTFTATVSPSTATGKVQFLLNGTNFGSPVVLASDQAIFSTASLPGGTDNISATYSGNSNFNPSNSNSVTVTVTTNSGGGQPGNGISSATNLGQLVSDFVHARNALLKEQRNQSLAVVHECKVEIKNASHTDRKQIEADCKVKLQEIKQHFKGLQQQLKQEFEQLKAQFKSTIEQEHKQQTNVENNETQNSDKQVSFPTGNIANHGNGSGKHLGNQNAHAQHGHKDKKHKDD